MSRDIHRARILPENDRPQAQNAPAFEFMQAHEPQAFCQQIGLNWIAALELHRTGLLSFDPRAVTSLTRSQEAEVHFLGRLAAAGCCASVMATLLKGLEKPYTYNLDRMYYDWHSRQWRLLEDTEHIEENLEGWLKELVDWGDAPVLEHVRAMVEGALLELQARQRAINARQHEGIKITRGRGAGL